MAANLLEGTLHGVAAFVVVVTQFVLECPVAIFGTTEVAAGIPDGGGQVALEGFFGIVAVLPLAANFEDEVIDGLDHDGVLVAAALAHGVHKARVGLVELVGFDRAQGRVVEGRFIVLFYNILLLFWLGGTRLDGG